MQKIAQRSLTWSTHSQKSAHSAQRTAHSAQRTAHSAQRTAHSVSDNSTQKRDSAIIAQSIFYAHINFRRKFSHNLFGVKPIFALQATLALRATFALFLGAAFVLASCDPPKSSTPKAWHVSTFAGNMGDYTKDGIGKDASFSSPIAITQSDDTLYVLGFLQGTIRTIAKNNAEVKTIVSGAIRGSHSNGPGTTARFNQPTGLVINGTTLYVADKFNHRIRAVGIGATAAATQVSDVAGSGTAGHANGAGATAQFNGPTGLAVSGSTLYVADQKNHRIRAIDLARKTVRDIAGSGTAGDTDATGTDAQFRDPVGIATDGTTLYIADEKNHRIRTVAIATGVVSTLAGSTQGYKDGVGTAAQFNRPFGVALSGNTLYVTDTRNYRIRAIDIASKEVSTLAGSTQGNTDGVGTAAQFDDPVGIVVSGKTLYVSDMIRNSIRKIEYK